MILPIEKQVCSLELSRKLKGLGVKQESYLIWEQYWNWHYDERTDSMIREYSEIAGILRFEQRSNSNGVIEESRKSNNYGYEIYSAFTVAELGEMFPATEQIRDTRVNDVCWACDVMTQRTFGDTEADARAKMLIYLIEQDLIKAESL